jgi:YggT family protein
VELLGGIIRLVLLSVLVLLLVRFVVDWVQVFARSWTP